MNSIYKYFKPQDFRNFHQNDQSSSSDFSDVETDESSGRRPADADSGGESFEIGQEVRLHGLTGKLISIFNGRVEEKNHLCDVQRTRIFQSNSLVFDFSSSVTSNDSKIVLL